MAVYRYYPKDAPWLVQGGRSEAAAKGWESRWEQAFWEGGKLGPKGEAYIEQKYGPTIGGGEEGEEDWPDDTYDFSDEEEDTPEM